MLARTKFYAATPASDEEVSDAQWLGILTEAQYEWTATIAGQYPYAMLGAPALMSTVDGGETYFFSASVRPFAVQIMDSKNGRLLLPSTNWDPSGGYVWEGERIRIPRGATRTFPDGAPYARYIAAPTAVLTTTGTFTLQPDWARILLIWRSLVKYATIGGLRDPTPYQIQEDKAWYGQPEKGDLGVMGQLKMLNPFYGAAAYAHNRDLYGLDFLNVNSSYSPL